MAVAVFRARKVEVRHSKQDDEGDNQVRLIWKLWSSQNLRSRNLNVESSEAVTKFYKSMKHQRWIHATASTFEEVEVSMIEPHCIAY